MTMFKHSRARCRYTAGEAAEAVIECAGMYGNIESLKVSARADKTSRMLAQIVSKLHAKGTLTDADVLDLVGDDWEIVEAA